jgi:hypothetical protein
MKVFEFSSKTNFQFKEVNPKPESKFKIGETVAHVNAKWRAIVKAKKFDYAYGLYGVSKEKFWLYTLQDKAGWEILGLWGEPELMEA